MRGPSSLPFPFGLFYRLQVVRLRLVFTCSVLHLDPVPIRTYVGWKIPVPRMFLLFALAHPYMPLHTGRYVRAVTFFTVVHCFSVGSWIPRLLRLHGYVWLRLPDLRSFGWNGLLYVALQFLPHVGPLPVLPRLRYVPVPVLYRLLPPRLFNAHVCGRILLI